MKESNEAVKAEAAAFKAEAAAFKAVYDATWAELLAAKAEYEAAWAEFQAVYEAAVDRPDTAAENGSIAWLKYKAAEAKYVSQLEKVVQL